jgi:hypothetical protein
MEQAGSARQGGRHPRGFWVAERHRNSVWRDAGSSQQDQEWKTEEGEVSAMVLIKDMESGEIRPHPIEYEWDEYQWTDGNFGCDCNRGLFFSGNDDWEIPCGETRFRIRCVAENGEILYSEID